MRSAGVTFIVRVAHPAVPRLRRASRATATGCRNPRGCVTQKTLVYFRSLLLCEWRDQSRFHSSRLWRFGHDGQCTQTARHPIRKNWIENAKRVHPLAKEFFTPQEDD